MPKKPPFEELKGGDPGVGNQWEYELENGKRTGRKRAVPIKEWLPFEERYALDKTPPMNAPRWVLDGKEYFLLNQPPHIRVLMDKHDETLRLMRKRPDWKSQLKRELTKIRSQLIPHFLGEEPAPPLEF